MEQRFWRLTLLIALLSVLITAITAAYSWHQEREAKLYIDAIDQSLNNADAKCGRDRSSPFCDIVESRQKELHDAIVDRESQANRKLFSLRVMLFAPLLVFFAFFAGRWVITGERPSLQRKALR